EAGYGEYKIASCDLNVLTEKVVRRYEAAAREQKKKIIMRLDKTGRPIAVDSDMIEIVVANLVENALWYTREDGTIDVATSFDAKGVTLAVSDTGVGIPVEMRDVVFQKFKRSPAAVVMNTNGSGLGLYIVRNIVEQHGGAITFDSTEGKGTTFRVRIPG
ncbi:MAG: HAMP domain-containing histidine kinase, partial [Candidatus Sungbacteria bacterium]|nr:HAMP domain-containing histidine kinase [Candidatus Sungbacteria bacterium]